jgi:hypothetical protein
MKGTKRNLLVLFRHGQGIEQEAECLFEILLETSSPEQFCIANELVDRNYITSKKEKILKESRHLHLRAFRFFINKN